MLKITMVIMKPAGEERLPGKLCREFDSIPPTIVIRLLRYWKLELLAIQNLSLSAQKALANAEDGETQVSQTIIINSQNLVCK